jgi:hypothetical protein
MDPTVLATELAIRTVVRGLSVGEAARELEISRREAASLMMTESYQTARHEALQRLSRVFNREIDDQANRLRSMVPLALDKIQERLVEDWEGISPTDMRLLENVLDRGGLPRKTEIQQDVSITLDEETIKRIKQAELDLNAIEVIDAEWDYATQRGRGGADAGPGHDSAGRQVEGSHAVEGRKIDVLHGQERNRVRGPDDDLPRRYGPLDRESLVETEAGPGFAGAPQNQPVDDLGLAPTRRP